ncbi:MAG: DUF2779 domain-containing protein [Erysipelotrichaceae bacterium]|jgi:hypothetical protein|nr:DUF2779 domain-containing protein [Erysipelotrichaceae bacterium]HCY07195.1 DUF2779 domain-containing protein [Erysipelotrichaceae bacterium]
MYHISDLRKYLRCPRLFQLSFNEKSTSFNPYVRLDQQVTELAIEKLKIDDYFLGVVNDEPDKALDAMNNYDWIVKGRFEYKNLRIKVPFLHKNEDGWNLYFLFIGNFPHEDDVLFYTSTVWVLINNDINIKDINIIHLNNEYVREDELDVNKLFVISNHFYNAKNNKASNVKELIFRKMRDYSSILSKMNNLEENELVEPKRVKACTRFGKCKYYDDCFNEEKIEDNSILTLVSSQYKHHMYKDGIRYLKDVDLDRLEGSRKQYAQIRADENGGLFYDKFGLSLWLSKIKFPISFLDFEWETFSIPPYKGMKTYDVLPFQYSLHILDENNNITHKEFIGFNDTRLDLINNLINDIPLEGSIMAYNGNAAEKLRIKELAKSFPEYKKQLMNIHSRIIDLQFPFDLGLIYDTRMKGQYSLKRIMSVVDEVGYDGLEIDEGMKAVYNWRFVDRAVNNEEKEEIIKNLKLYCAMDTYSMIVIYRWLKKLVVK